MAFPEPWWKLTFYSKALMRLIFWGGTVLAVKVVEEQCSQGYRGFKREFQIASGIGHSNLVRMVGSIQRRELKAIFFFFGVCGKWEMGTWNLEQHQYYTGGSGGGAGELKLRERMGIAIDIAHGLEYVSPWGLLCPIQVVHCDLKVQNLYVN